MASVVSQLIQEVTAHAQSDSLEDAREICADGTYFPNSLLVFGSLLHQTPNTGTQFHLIHDTSLQQYWLTVHEAECTIMYS